MHQSGWLNGARLDSNSKPNILRLSQWAQKFRYNECLSSYQPEYPSIRYLSGTDTWLYWVITVILQPIWAAVFTVCWRVARVKPFSIHGYKALNLSVFYVSLEATWHCNDAISQRRQSWRDRCYSRTCFGRPPFVTYKCSLSRQVVSGDRMSYTLYEIYICLSP